MRKITDHWQTSMLMKSVFIYNCKPKYGFINKHNDKYTKNKNVYVCRSKDSGALEQPVSGYL